MLQFPASTLNFFIVWPLSSSFGSYSYPELYSYPDDYAYSSEAGEEEEAAIHLLPQLVTQPTRVLVREGSSARLECQVDRLGPLVISWKKMDKTGVNYLATGGIKLVNDSRVTVLPSSVSSRLLISQVREEDAGEYVCELSSQPPMHVTHTLALKKSPSVAIMGRTASGRISVREGEELALVCQGAGEPPPKLRWLRLNQSMTDGAPLVEGDQLIYSRASRNHEGLYACQGFTEEEGVLAQQRVTVIVKYAPLVTVEKEYIHGEFNLTLELICTVVANPVAKVKWKKEGSKADFEQSGETKNIVEFRAPDKHVLIISPIEQRDFGLYTCLASNSEGRAEAVLDVKSGSFKVGNPETVRVAEHHSARNPGHHHLLRQIMTKMNKVEGLNKEMVTALKEQNRFMLAFMRNQKEMLQKMNRTENTGTVL